LVLAWQKARITEVQEEQDGKDKVENEAGSHQEWHRRRERLH